MGNSCVRFRKLDDVALDALVDAIERFDVPSFIALVGSVQSARKRGRASGQPDDEAPGP